MDSEKTPAPDTSAGCQICGRKLCRLWRRLGLAELCWRRSCRIPARALTENDGQEALFESFRYRLVLTNLPRSYNAREVVDLIRRQCRKRTVSKQARG